MSSSSSPTFRLACALALCAASLGCELDPNCDPDVDENCEAVTDTADAGAADTTVADTTTGPTEVFRYVYIFDLGAGTGTHPGADIDAIEVFSGGTSRYAVSVTDRYLEPGIANAAADAQQVLGPPDIASGSAHTCDVSAAVPHWYSLGIGGWIVVDMGPQGIQDGDEIIVYECAGVADPYGYSIGITSRIDSPSARFYELTLDAVGYSRATVNFSALGIN